MTDELLEQTAFHVLGERAEHVLAETLRRIPVDADWRVLDLGCGTGEAAFEVAGQRPGVTVVGIDVSEPSIAAAQASLAGHPARDRVAFHLGDYFAADLGEPFDLIIADGVVHLIPGSTERLCAKLAADLRPGGLLLVEMPHDAIYNRAMGGMRRVLRAIRTPALDELGMAVARRLHSGEMPENQLRERLIYVYVPPERLAGPALDAALAEHGLRLVARRTLRQVSPAQLRHHLSVFRREAS